MTCRLLRDAPGLGGAEEALPEDQACPSQAALRRGSRARRAAGGRGRRDSISTIPRTASPTRRCGCCFSWPSESGLRERIDAMFRGDKINVTENRAVLHVALRAPTRRVDPASTARTSCPRSTPCSTRWRRSPTACAAARGRATPASASATSSTSASAAPISGPVMAYEALRHYSERDLTFRFVSNVDGTDFAEAVARSRSRRDAVHRLLQDLHHAGDDDQRAHRARLAAGRPEGRAGRRRPSISSPSRPMPRRWRSSASTRPTCSASGIGSAAATRWIRPSACRPCSPSGRTTSAPCSTASTRWTSISAPRRSSATCRC